MHKKKYINLNQVLILACELGDIESVQQLISDPYIKYKVDVGSSIRRAAAHGNLGIVRLLVSNKHFRAHVYENAALRAACRNRHYNIVKYLLTIENVRNNMYTDECQVMIHVIMNGNDTKLQKILKPYIHMINNTYDTIDEIDTLKYNTPDVVVNANIASSMGDRTECMDAAIKLLMSYHKNMGIKRATLQVKNHIRCALSENTNGHIYTSLNFHDSINNNWEHYYVYLKIISKLIKYKNILS